MNELSQETSPYLLQHAQNPVHWKAWNARALAQAQQENKPIIVSVGYSACHWCHVMEHETFEDQEAAAVMNAYFVNIKVDREERPDIDAVYMKAVQLMTGRGGWPMNVVCLPDGRPVYGGTYFRKPEWINILGELQELWQANPAKMIEYAEKLHTGIKAISVIPPKETQDELSQDLLAALVQKWEKSFDPEFGGMARAPKFMMPNNYAFLMRYGFQNHNQPLLDFVDLTLTKMAHGGLFDTVGGGFSRYSVDMRWHVPHFEKMLYDNGQLVSLYADAYKRTQNPLYREVIEKTLDFVSRELTTEEGAFYSALDADSLNAENHLEEGAFYVWTQSELEKLIGSDFALFAEVFNINDFGHWENGNYVLIQTESLEAIAKRHNILEPELQNKKQHWEKTLFAQREKRPKPRRDDKSLTSWNAIMLKSYVDAYKALQKPEYLQSAIKNGHFILQKQWHPDGHLLHSYKNGHSTINGYLEDYALTAEALIGLYEATFDESWLAHAKQLTDYCFEYFFDAQSGFFRFTSNLDQELIATHYETEDNVIPASNSVMAHNLYRLSVYFENSYYEEVLLRMLGYIAPDVDYPSAFSNWLNLLLNYSGQNLELAICGENAPGYALEVNRQYLPHVVLAGGDKNTGSGLPFLKDRYFPGKDLFYRCQNRTCDRPSEDFASVNQYLKP